MLIFRGATTSVPRLMKKTFSPGIITITPPLAKTSVFFNTPSEKVAPVVSFHELQNSSSEIQENKAFL